MFLILLRLSKDRAAARETDGGAACGIQTASQSASSSGKARTEAVKISSVSKLSKPKSGVA